MFSVPGKVYKVPYERTIAVPGTAPEQFPERFRVPCERTFAVPGTVLGAV